MSSRDEFESDETKQTKRYTRVYETIRHAFSEPLRTAYSTWYSSTGNPNKLGVYYTAVYLGLASAYKSTSVCSFLPNRRCFFLRREYYTTWAKAETKRHSLCFRYHDRPSYYSPSRQRKYPGRQAINDLNDEPEHTNKRRNTACLCMAYIPSPLVVATLYDL